MATEITTGKPVALYDTVGEWAIGPVFETRDLAEDFLSWLAQKPRRPVLPIFSARNDFADPRAYETPRLVALVAEWRADRVDPETGGLRCPAS